MERRLEYNVSKAKYRLGGRGSPGPGAPQEPPHHPPRYPFIILKALTGWPTPPFPQCSFTKAICCGKGGVGGGVRIPAPKVTNPTFPAMQFYLGNLLRERWGWGWGAQPHLSHNAVVRAPGPTKDGCRIKSNWYRTMSESDSIHTSLI